MTDTSQTKIFAYYFPQYHSFPENDRVFGKGFTDWDLYKSVDPRLCKFPLEPPLGLGFYNTTETDVRRKQGELAKKYGIHGFIYYHYWLENKPVMSQPLENLLIDSEPNLPFCFCFANESWKQNYGKKNEKGEFNKFHPDGATYRQLYDNSSEHAEYLQRFFNHPNYYKINGKPVMFVYQLDNFIGPYLDKLCCELEKYAIPGIYYIQNTSRYCLRQCNNPTRKPDAYSPFAPHRLNTKLGSFFDDTPCVIGGLTGWNNNPRRANDSNIVNYTPKELENLIIKDLMAIATDNNYINLLTLFAWNEWAEGAILEPNTFYGEELGEAVKLAQQKCEIVKCHMKKNTFLYGTRETSVDITKDVYTKCIKFSDDTITIHVPQIDTERDKLFGDPLPYVKKVIMRKSNIVEFFDNTLDVNIDIATSS